MALDRYADSWFIADSSLRGYDGSQNVRDEERAVGRKKLKRKPEPKRRIRWPKWTGISGSTLRDWLPIVGTLLVPLLIFYGTAQITQGQANSEAKRAEAERELAEQRAQDEALQAYLDQMSELMLERKLLEAEPGDPVHTLAQARTSTVILRLDSEHNESVTRFLIDSGLARSGEGSARLLSEITLSHATLSYAFLLGVDLDDADLSGADLSFAYLSFADLSGANLSAANLSDANLSQANLTDAYLYQANLSGAFLSFADLITADLTDANLKNASLREANLSYARLSYAYLSKAYLSKADLSYADLSYAKGWTEGQFRAAHSLEGATMPDGQTLRGDNRPDGPTLEEWIKDKKAREEGG